MAIDTHPATQSVDTIERQTEALARSQPGPGEQHDERPVSLEELAAVLVDAADNLPRLHHPLRLGSAARDRHRPDGTASEINTTGTEAIHASDPYALQNALPARCSANATFQSHIAIKNGYAQMESANSPERLAEKPWFENSNMDGPIAAAATANNYVLLYGDVAKGFVIVDRISSTLEIVPHLAGANGRPTGQRGALFRLRTGSEVVVPNAFRLLDVPMTVTVCPTSASGSTPPCLAGAGPLLIGRRS